MKKIIFTALFIFTCSFCYSQVTQQWVARYSNGYTSIARGAFLTVDNLGNIFVAGHNLADIKVLAYHPNGTYIWAFTSGGPGDGYSNDIAHYDTSNIYILGSGQYGIGPGYGVILIKMSLTNIEWSIQDNDLNGYRFGTKIITDDSGNVYIGEKYGTFVSGTGALVKFNSSGSMLWKDTLGRVYSLIHDVSGNIIASGTENFNNFIIKFNPSGTPIWIKTIPGPGAGNDAPTALASDNNGNIYMTGTNGTKAITVKYNASGTQQWIVNYGPPANYCSANSIGLDNRGNVYIAGNAIYNGVSDFIILKFNSNGDTVWTNSYSGFGFNNYLSAMFTDTAGNCYVTGASYRSSNPRTEDYLTLKYNSMGELKWQMRYNGTADSEDIATDIYVDNFNNVYVTGNSKGNITGYDIVTIKYTQPIGIKKISGSVPESFALYQNYPNPFNPSTTIEFSLPLIKGARGMDNYRQGGEVGLFVKLSIFDITGREVATLVNESLQPGKYKVDWNASDYSSGIYFYKLVAGDFISTKKMILIK